MRERLICLVKGHDPIKVITRAKVTHADNDDTGFVVWATITGKRTDCRRCGKILHDGWPS